MAQDAVDQGEKPLSSRMMPRDVAIRWNSTYEMLTFAYTYRQAYNELTDNRGMKLRKYEVLDSEWEIVKQLANVLKVCTLSVTLVFRFFLIIVDVFRSLKTRPFSFLALHQISRRLFPPWITLTSILQQLQRTRNTCRLFKLPSRSGNAFSTNTTPLPTSLKSTALR